MRIELTQYREPIPFAGDSKKSLASAMKLWLRRTMERGLLHGVGYGEYVIEFEESSKLGITGSYVINHSGNLLRFPTKDGLIDTFIKHVLP
jgi:hypothetical protein